MARKTLTISYERRTPARLSVSPHPKVVDPVVESGPLSSRKTRRLSGPSSPGPFPPTPLNLSSAIAAVPTLSGGRPCRGSPTSPSMGCLWMASITIPFWGSAASCPLVTFRSLWASPDRCSLRAGNILSPWPRPQFAGQHQQRILDVKLEQKDQAILLLSSLPKSYETLKTTLLIGNETFLVDDVMSALMDSSRVNGTSSSSQGEDIGHLPRKCPERKDKKNGKKHMKNTNVAEEDEKSNDGDLYLVSSVEQQEGGVVKVSKGAMVIMKGQKTKNLYKLMGNTVIGGASRTKSADESRDGSKDEQSLEDPDEHPSDSWNLVRDREPRIKEPTQSAIS
ncbi:hypothetical protein RJ640_022818 [Escallonia rubra]|uniref:Retrovirus-related Pol polyprotein from transposon TNT 1-94 n=1 Tax=Escallonia rubra TaxID=112253 RepID=A0AA88QTX9_9ASTE|nr:hypothetical protein RJ640_022818 [Escallonia rubra]